MPPEFDLGFDPRRTLLDLIDSPPALDHLEIAEERETLRILGRPARRLNPAELYLLLQQGIALEFAVPLAVDRLDSDPFAEAGGRPGGLLTAILEAPVSFWIEHETLWHAVIGILERAVSQIAAQARPENEDEDLYLPAVIGDDFMAALMHFRAIHGAREDGE